MNKIEMSLVKWVLKRIMSRSPEFYVRVRIVAGIIMFLLYGASWAIGQNALPISAHAAEQISNITATLAKLFTGLFGATWMGTTDPELMSPSSKDAITKEKNAGNNPVV